MHPHMNTKSEIINKAAGGIFVSDISDGCGCRE